MIMRNNTLKMLFITVLIIFCASISRVKSTGTVFPVDKFDPVSDATEIHAALDGVGTDETCLREILTDRSCKQRISIQKEYEKLYKKDDDLWFKIAEDTSGTYERILKDLFYCGPTLIAVHLGRTFRTDDPYNGYNFVIGLVMASENAKIHDEVITAYPQIYANPLELDVDDLDDEDDYTNIIKEMIRRKRTPFEKLEPEKAKEAAKKLMDEMVFWEDRHPELDQIVMESPCEQLKLTLDEFFNMNGEPLEEAVNENYYESMPYQHMIRFCRDPTSYYAEVLIDAVEGQGTNEQIIILLILYLSETTLVEVKQKFQDMFDRDLMDKIGHDTSGALENMLKALIVPSQTYEDKKKKIREKRWKKQEEMKKKREAPRGGK